MLTELEGWGYPPQQNSDDAIMAWTFRIWYLLLWFSKLFWSNQTSVLQREWQLYNGRMQTYKIYLGSQLKDCIEA